MKFLNQVVTKKCVLVINANCRVDAALDLSKLRNFPVQRIAEISPTGSCYWERCFCKTTDWFFGPPSVLLAIIDDKLDGTSWL